MNNSHDKEGIDNYNKFAHVKTLDGNLMKARFIQYQTNEAFTVLNGA